MEYPTPQQRAFFEATIANRDGTILTLKRVENLEKGGTRGFSVNVRGPFMLARYDFESGAETVIDAVWANAKAKESNSQESDSHLHCAWDQWRFAVRSTTNKHVRDNIKYDYQLAFFNDEAVSGSFAQAEIKDNNKALFWFYLKTVEHDACKVLPENRTINIFTWPDSTPANPS